MFIIGEDDRVIADPDPGRLDLDLKGWVGTDANGYEFGRKMLSATADCKWVSYVYKNPVSGSIGSGDFSDLELKNAWVVRHDSLLFGSGWHVAADAFTKQLVADRDYRHVVCGFRNGIGRWPHRFLGCFSGHIQERQSESGRER